MSKHSLRSHEDLSGYLDLLDITYSSLKESSQKLPSLSEDPHEIIQDLLSQLVNTRKKALEMIKIAKKFYKVQEDCSKANSSLVSEIQTLQFDINLLSSRLSSQSKDLDTKDQQFDTMVLELHETEKEYRGLLIVVDELRKELKTLRERKNSPSLKDRKSLLKVQELKLEEIRALNATVQDYRDELGVKAGEINDLNEKIKELSVLLNSERVNSEKNKGFLCELKNENRDLRERVEDLEICLDSEKNAVFHLENEMIKQKSHTDNLIKEYDRQKRASFLGNSFLNNDLLHYIDDLNKNDEKTGEAEIEVETEEKKQDLREEEEVLPLYKKHAPKIENLGDWIDEESDYMEISHSEPALSKQARLFVLSSPVVSYEKRFQFPFKNNIQIEKCETINIINYKKSSAKSTVEIKKTKKNKKVFTFDEFESGDNITPIRQSKELKICSGKNMEIKGKNKGIINISDQGNIGINTLLKEKNPEIKDQLLRLEICQGFSKEFSLEVERKQEMSLENFRGFSLKNQDFRVQNFAIFSRKNKINIEAQVQNKIMIIQKNKTLFFSNERQSSVSIGQAIKNLSLSNESNFCLKSLMDLNLCSFASISKHNFPAVSYQLSWSLKPAKNKITEICSESAVSISSKNRKLEFQSLDSIKIKQPIAVKLENFPIVKLNKIPLVSSRYLNDSIQSCIFIDPKTHNLSEFHLNSKPHLEVNTVSLSLNIHKAVKNLKFVTEINKGICPTRQNIKLESFQNFFKPAVLNIEKTSCFKVQQKKGKIFSIETSEVASVYCKFKVESGTQHSEIVEKFYPKGVKIKQDLSLNHEAILSINSFQKRKVFLSVLENSLLIKQAGSGKKNRLLGDFETTSNIIFNKPCLSLPLLGSPTLKCQNLLEKNSLNLSVHSMSVISIHNLKPGLCLANKDIQTHRKYLELANMPLFAIFPIKKFDSNTQVKISDFITLTSSLSIFPIHAHWKKLEISKTINLDVVRSEFFVKDIKGTDSKSFPGNRDPIKDFFVLTCQSIKLNSLYKDKIGQIPFDSLYKSVEEDKIPFNHWYVYLKQKMESIKKCKY